MHSITQKCVLQKQTEMQALTFSLFIAFCVSAFIIPDSVMFGESLCFVYTYAMLQMLQVALFTGNSCGTLILAIFATVLPILQLLKAIQNNYTIGDDNLYGELYMGKEILLYMITKNTDTKRVYTRRHVQDRLVVAVVTLWVVMDIVFFLKDINMSYRTTTDKCLYIIRFTPVFLMSVVNM